MHVYYLRETHSIWMHIWSIQLQQSLSNEEKQQRYSDKYVVLVCLRPTVIKMKNSNWNLRNPFGIISVQTHAEKERYGYMYMYCTRCI